MNQKRAPLSFNELTVPCLDPSVPTKEVSGAFGVTVRSREILHHVMAEEPPGRPEGCVTIPGPSSEVFKLVRATPGPELLPLGAVWGQRWWHHDGVQLL